MKYWIVQIDCIKMISNLKTHNNNHIHQDIPNYKYKDNKNNMEMIPLQEMNHLLL